MPTRRNPDPDSFTANYVDWNSPRLQGRQQQLDKALSDQRGMKARSGLQASQELFETRKANAERTVADPSTPSAKKASASRTAIKADKDARTVEKLASMPDVKDRPTTVEAISHRYGDLFETATQHGIARGEQIPGTAWYFEHRRQQESALGKDHGLSPRQITAMGGKLSAGKTPEDEQVSMAGINDLRRMPTETINGQRISDISSADIGRHASTTAAWGTHREQGRTAAPHDPDPEAAPHVKDALRRAGRAHEANIGTAMSIARGEITPKEGFGEGTPKTSAYAEMQAQSTPGSIVETDYRNVAAHYRDTRAGTQSRDQGMFMFSQDKPGPRAHALGSDTPTAIDTWMIAAGSGQPLSGRDPSTGRQISPAKRLVDKDFPLSPSDQGKRQLGLVGTDVSPEAAVSAQHNEAIRHLSEDQIGPISHDQHGQRVNVPSSLIQESVWTQARRDAGWDPAFNKQERQAAAEVKATDKALSAAQKRAAKAQGTLF